jgi:Ala-tRNA(Pro) deacylase
MASEKLKSFLDSRGIKYVTIKHSPAFTAPEIAASSDISGRIFAKTVVVDIAGEQALVVLPANRKIMLSDLRDLFDDPEVKLAAETDFMDRFPDCELGAMPPFGNLYGLPVYIAPSFTEEREIAFNAGTHHEVIKMEFKDFDRLVQPTVLDFATV